MWKVRVTSTGKEMGCMEEEEEAPPFSPGFPSCSLSDSVLLELDTTVAARVGRATCSINSSRLCVSFISSGSDSTTAESESTPLLTGKGRGCWCWCLL